MKIFRILTRNIEKALASKSTTDLAKELLTEYHDYLNIFFWADLNILLAHYLYDHKIPLMEKKTLP